MDDPHQATPPAAPRSAAVPANGDGDAATPVTAGGGGGGRPSAKNPDMATTNSAEEGNLPPELPLTPQSHNKGLLEVDEASLLTAREHLALLVGGDDDGAEAPSKGKPQQPKFPIDKDYARNMSALSVSTGEGSLAAGAGLSYDEGEQSPDTPKSSLVSARKSFGEAKGADEVSGAAPSKTVDWLPQQQNEKKRGDSSLSGATSQAVKTGDDVTITSFTTFTTAGDMGGVPPAPPPLSPSGDVPPPCLSPPPVSSNGTAGMDNAATLGSVHNIGSGVPLMPGRAKTGYPIPAISRSGRGRVSARSPRPPRHMRAVDWCPPSSASSLGVASAGSGRAGGSAAGSSAMASDKTAVTARAVRLGDDATVTTFATMTTMGDAGSILEADTEDEASSSDGEAGGGSSDREEEGSMEDAADGDGVVDKIPHPHRSRGIQTGASSLSGATNHAVRASDDQSVVTFATATTAGGADRGGAHVVDKVPSFAPRADDTVVTNETVQMGDNQSLATWATANTMGGQLTGNVVDHVPSNADDDDTVGTSNAVNEDPSVNTFAMSATSGVSAINEVVDKIPTFAGGGGTGRSVVSGVTGQAARLGLSGHPALPSDDRSVASFATMTTMGDLGSIYETEPLEDERPTSVFPNNSYCELDRAVVDVIPEATSSVASGTTNHSVRTGGDSGSVMTFGTMGTLTTAGGGRREPEGDGNVNEDDVVDQVPNYPDKPSLVASVTTNHAVRLNDDQSVATWATVTTSGGGLLSSHANEHVVDMTPREDSSIVSDTETNLAQKDEEDQSVVTWNTMTTAGGVKSTAQPPAKTAEVNNANENGTDGGGRRELGSNMEGEQNANDDDVVDKVPNYPDKAPSIASGTTHNAVRLNDDQSVATWATMTTSGRGLSGHINEHVVDMTPREDSSVMSDTETNLAQKDEEDQSVVTWNTMTTSGGAKLTAQPPAETAPLEDRNNANENDRKNDVVDKVPTYPNNSGSRSVVSGTTNRAVRINDDQSVATWATMATSVGLSGHTDEHVVDKTPREDSSNSSMVSETETNLAQKDEEDQSVVTWNTMTTAGNARSVRSPPPPALAPSAAYAVDRVPSFSNNFKGTMSLSGATNHAVRAADDQSVVTFATMTTVGGMERGDRHMVDKVPSFAPRTDSTSIVTNDTVQMGDNQSLATWATANTMGGQLTGNVVDHVPLKDEDEDTVGTSNAIKEDPSVMTFTTAATSGNQGINEVVDRIPTFAGGGTGQSVASGATNQAVRMGDDRSIASFATMATVGNPGSVYTYSNIDNGRLQRPYPGNNNNLVDRIPSSPGVGHAQSSKVSERTDNAAKLGNDSTMNAFATNMTGQNGGNAHDFRAMGSDQSASGSAAGSARFIMAPPTTGILRDSRRSRPPSALRDGPNREYRTSNSDSSAPPIPESAADLPINVGESVSNTHILRAISDLRFHVDYRMGEMRELNRRDSERVLQIVQQEQAKRTALESRLHSQLLLQNESMVAMELKLLRLEAKVAHRDSRRQRRQPNVVNTVGTANAPAAMITDRLPPIAATPSTPNRSDEEVDSFEELELTPRGANRYSGSGLFVTHGGMMHRGGVGPHGGPANIAVVTRSGASVASAVTATSFQEGEFSHAMNEDERSADGDIEDEGDRHDDGSTSTPTLSSRNRISNLESILLNPIQTQQNTGGSNDQGISTRAVRGDTDGQSSLPTSVTSATMASTVVTAITRGGESEGITLTRRTSEDEVVRGQRAESVAEEEDLRRAQGSHLRSQHSEEYEAPRSRSQSPLTVQSDAVGTQSVASASLGPSILSTAAVAPSRSFGTRRANAAAAIANAEAMSGSRSMANRVVSFTTNDLALTGATSSMTATGGQPSQLQENDGGGDSITMPDELDNFSDIADAFSNSARAWREEYEGRLDAIHKRLGN